MTVVPFPLDHDQPFRVLGRDDFVLCYQSGLNAGVAGIGADGRPFSMEIPVYKLQLAFGKRAGASNEPQRSLPREEDRRPQEIADALRQFANAMAGNEDMTPCA